MRRNISVVGLTGCAAYASLMRSGRNENASTPTSANAMPHQRYAPELKDKIIGAMAGHSRWANIQHRKGRQDAKRGKVFTQLIKEVSVAARLGGGEPAAQPRPRPPPPKT